MALRSHEKIESLNLFCITRIGKRMPAFTIYDIEVRIHHFYRHEQSFEKRLKTAAMIEHERSAKALGREHRLRWISYFHLADSVELRLQSTLSKNELEEVFRRFLPQMREVLGWGLNGSEEA